MGEPIGGYDMPIAEIFAGSSLARPAR